MIMNNVKPVLLQDRTVNRYHAPQARRNKPQSGLQIRDGIAELLIYDDIGEFFGMGVSAEKIVKQLADMGDDAESVTVRINSPGGDVFDGGAIYNALARTRIPVNVQIDGLAASIASVIAMAGDTITMADNAMMMIHNPWMVSMGDADILRADAGVLDQVRDGLVRIYTARTGQPEQLIQDLMAAETWMTATEALEHGFTEEVTDPVGVSNRADLAAFPYHHVPKAWTEPVEPPAPAPDMRDRVAALAERRAAL